MAAWNVNNFSDHEDYWKTVLSISEVPRNFPLADKRVVSKVFGKSRLANLLNLPVKVLNRTFHFPVFKLFSCLGNVAVEPDQFYVQCL